MDTVQLNSLSEHALQTQRKRHPAQLPTDSCSSMAEKKDVLDKTVQFLQKREGIDKVLRANKITQ